MDGLKSTTRINAGDSIRFAIRVGMAMMDPSMMVKLYRFDAKKGKREAVMSSMSGAYGHSKSTENANEIKLNTQKSGTDDFIMIPHPD